MAFDFPSSPTVGQQYSPVAGTTYIWNGYGWVLQSPPISPGPPVQIARVDVSSPVASVDFTSGIDATYDEYELHLINVTITANGQPGLQISQDGGATWKAGVTDYTYGGRYIPFATTSASYDGGSGGANAINLTSSPGVNQSAGSGGVGMNGTVKFWQPSKAAIRKSFLFDVIYQNPTDGMTQYRGAGNFILNDNAFNGLRLLVSGTTFSGGSVVLYGIKK